MATVKRWVITDPYDTNPATRTYLFPRNPKEMTSLHAVRSVSSMTTTTGRILLYEGQAQAVAWEFSGPILDKQQFTDLYAWVYDRKNRLTLTDHFGRVISLVFTEFNATPVRRVNYYYSHDYVVRSLVLSITDPTVPNTGPLV